jgi:hypothetical protein
MNDEKSAGDTSTTASGAPQRAAAARNPNVTSENSRRIPVGGFGM